MVVAFDTLAYARRLRDAGIPPPEAEAHADAAREFIMAELVTKPDLLAVRADIASIREEIGAAKTELREEIGAVKTELREEIGAVKSELRAEIGSLKTELRAEIGAVRSDLHNEIIATKRDLQESIAVARREMIAAMANVELRVTMRLGTVMAVGIGILAAVIKL
jgi:hypothetical protein